MPNPGAYSNKPTTDRMNLYRLEDIAPTVEGLRKVIIRGPDDDPLTIEERQIAGCPALAVTSYRIRETVRWNQTIATILGIDPGLGSMNPGCLLLIAVDHHTYALTFGHGMTLLDARYIEAGFGLRFAVRVLNPARISHLTRNPMAGAGRYDQTLIPGGTNIGTFNIAPWGNLVRRFGGRAGSMSLLPTTGRLSNRAPHLTGADALSMRLGVTAKDLVADIREIARISQTASPVPELDFVTRIRKLGRADATLIADLDRALAEQLADFDTAVEIAVPHQALEVYDDIESYAVKIGGKRDTLASFDIGDVITRTWALPQERRAEALRKGYVTCFADREGKEPLGLAQIPAIKWITVEVFHGVDRFLLIDGAWYRIGAEHLEAIRIRVAEILARPVPFALPPCPAGTGEPKYLRDIVIPGAVCLDADVIKTALHPNGFEACDLFQVPQRVFVHVKRADRAQKLSHLFTQAAGSYDSFANDAEARQKFAAKVEQLTGEAIGVGFIPTEVMLGIKWRNGQPVTIDTLPVLSQINLLHAAHTMPGVNLTVDAIRES